MLINSNNYDYESKAMDVTVRNISADDYEKWCLLWSAYNAIGGGIVPEEITYHTWKRALSVDSPVICRVAEVEGQIVGFAMCVLHEGTYYIEPICYLEDFFVSDDMRGKGVGKAILTHLREEATNNKWAKVYWHTRSNNPARRLYDRFARTDDFVRYRMTFK